MRKRSDNVQQINTSSNMTALEIQVNHVPDKCSTQVGLHVAQNALRYSTDMKFDDIYIWLKNSTN